MAGCGGGVCGARARSDAEPDLSGRFAGAKHAGMPAMATFDTPAAQGGRHPSTSPVAPASGAEFPIGSTPVSCTATDGRRARASCSFSVIVEGIPQLAKTKFLAFGDSITAGTTSPAPTLLMLSVEDAYPLKLQRLLERALSGSDDCREQLGQGRRKDR